MCHTCLFTEHFRDNLFIYLSLSVGKAIVHFVYYIKPLFIAIFILLYRKKACCFDSEIQKDFLVITSAKEVLFSVQFACLPVTGLQKTYQPDFYETWWQGAVLAEEEPIKFWTDPSHGTDPYVSFHFH